jgi:hypothetical protein
MFVGGRLRRGRVITNRVAIMTIATKKPVPDRAAKIGEIWALWARVCSGTVDGGTGRRFRIEGRLVDVGVRSAVADPAMS